MFTLQEKPIDIHALPQYANSQSGAFVSFEGKVRADKLKNSTVVVLHYFADADSCNQEGHQIIQESIQQFHLNHAICVQRIGEINVTETAIWIGVWASHRDEAFQGCRYIIEEIKKRLHIWKKEILEDGKSIWIHGKETINL